MIGASKILYHDRCVQNWYRDRRVQNWYHDRRVQNWYHDRRVQNWCHDRRVQNWYHDGHVQNQSGTSTFVVFLCFSGQMLKSGHLWIPSSMECGILHIPPINYAIPGLVH